MFSFFPTDKRQENRKYKLLSWRSGWRFFFLVGFFSQKFSHPLPPRMIISAFFRAKFQTGKLYLPHPLMKSVVCIKWFPPLYDPPYITPWPKGPREYFFVPVYFLWDTSYDPPHTYDPHLETEFFLRKNQTAFECRLKKFSFLGGVVALYRSIFGTAERSANNSSSDVFLGGGGFQRSVFFYIAFGQYWHFENLFYFLNIISMEPQFHDFYWVSPSFGESLNALFQTNISLPS